MAELDLIRAIQAALTDRGARTVRWTGDDAAVVRARRARGHLDRHGRRRRALQLATHSPADVGWKALATALSDLAAMGADPGEAYVALVLPPGFEGALELVEAMEELAASCGTTIAGGDVVGRPRAHGDRLRDRLGRRGG